MGIADNPGGGTGVAAEVIPIALRDHARRIRRRQSAARGPGRFVGAEVQPDADRDYNVGRTRVELAYRDNLERGRGAAPKELCHCQALVLVIVNSDLILVIRQEWDRPAVARGRLVDETIDD